MLGPIIPIFEIHAAQRTRDLGMLLRGIGNLEGAQEVVDLDQSEQQAQIAALCRIRGLEQAGESAGELRSVYAADTLRRRIALFAVVMVRLVVLLLPGSVVASPDMPALVLTHVTAGHTAQRQLIR